MNQTVQLRIARPTDHLQEIVAMYLAGTMLEIVASFEDHQGFDGVILGAAHLPYHLEFTHHRGHQVGGAPTQDNLLVFYIPESDAWQLQCEKMEQAGFMPVPSYNPYWDVQGKTFEDIDAYRVVLQKAIWPHYHDK